MSLRRFDPFSARTSIASDPGQTRPSSVTSSDTDTLLGDPISSYQDIASTSEASIAVSPPGPRYVYYRVYTEDGLLLSKSAVRTGDRSLGRILGMAVTPPHTVLSLKKCLCRVEGFKDGQTMELFDSCTAQSPMDDKRTISLLTESGPGSSQCKPLALVVSPPFEGGGLSAIRCLRDFVTDSEPRYLYYVVYEKTGAVACKKPIDPSNPFISRINMTFIAPPLTVWSIARCVCSAEGISPGISPSSVRLFSNISGDSEFLKFQHIQVKRLADNGPDNPVALHCGKGGLSYLSWLWG